MKPTLLRRVQSWQLSLIAILIAVLALAACGGAAAEPVRYTIDMREYAFEPQSLEFKVGQEVEITLTNSGLLAHEIMFGRQVSMMHNRPDGYQTDMFMAAGIEPEVMMMGIDTMMNGHDEEEMHEGFMVVLPQGSATATIKFKVLPQMVGEWEMGCFEQDGVHYDAGMKGTVTVSR